MQITDEHVATGFYLVEQMEEPMGFIPNFSDYEFCGAMASLLTRNVRVDSLSGAEQKKFIAEVNGQRNALFVTIGPIYVAMGRRLPMVTKKMLEDIMESKGKVDRIDLSLLEKIRILNPFWHGVVNDIMADLEPFSRWTVATLATTFIDALPEPMEPYASPQEHDGIQDAIDDILGS